jgi:RNA polymerase sigma factor (sigma-70 family)
MTDESVSALLAGLASPAPGPAWDEFLRRYSATIMQIVRRYETDPDRVAECFQRVCESLSDRGFRRLLSYRQDSPASFRSWVSTVAANLCIDWRRQKRGRFRPVRAVTRLPEREQMVYRCIYVRGLSRAECLRLLTPRFPDLTEAEIADINARLFSLLTPRQRWQLGTRTAIARPQAGELTLEFDDAALQLEDPGPGPEQLLHSEQERGRLAAALAELPARERLLLRLRYEQDLTLAEVARLTGLHDPFRANRQIQAALAALAALINRSTADHDRKSPRRVRT